MPSRSPVAPPWHFSLAKRLIRQGIRGPGLWLRLARRLGLLRRGATYRLSDEVLVDVPIFRMETMWDEQEARDYERPLLDRLATVAQERLNAPMTLIDCGADIGMFSLGMVSRLSSLRQIVAFEPNAVAFPWLERNLARLAIKAHAASLAVGDTRGKVRLASPGYDASDHARFAEPTADGDLEMTRADQIDWLAHDMEVPRNLLIKIDVEGGELPAIRGSEELLRAADRVMVVVEMHPKVLARTGTITQTFLEVLSTYRPFKFQWAEHPTEVVETTSTATLTDPRHLVAISIA